MLKSDVHSQNIMTSMKKDIFTGNVFATTDLVVICKDGEKVQTHRNLFCSFSPIIREMLGSLQNIETVIIVPEVRKVAVEKVIKVMEMGWGNSVIFDKEVVILLNNLNIFLGESLIDIKKELKEAEDFYPIFI